MATSRLVRQQPPPPLRPHWVEPCAAILLPPLRLTCHTGRRSAQTRLPSRLPAQSRGLGISCHAPLQQRRRRTAAAAVSCSRPAQRLGSAAFFNHPAANSAAFIPVSSKSLSRPVTNTPFLPGPAASESAWQVDGREVGAGQGRAAVCTACKRACTQREAAARRHRARLQQQQAGASPPPPPPPHTHTHTTPPHTSCTPPCTPPRTLTASAPRSSENTDELSSSAADPPAPRSQLPPRLLPPLRGTLAALGNTPCCCACCCWSYACRSASWVRGDSGPSPSPLPTPRSSSLSLSLASEPSPSSCTSAAGFSSAAPLLSGPRPAVTRVGEGEVGGERQPQGCGPARQSAGAGE